MALKHSLIYSAFIQWHTYCVWREPTPRSPARQRLQEKLVSLRRLAPAAQRGTMSRCILVQAHPAMAWNLNLEDQSVNFISFTKCCCSCCGCQQAAQGGPGWQEMINVQSPRVVRALFIWICWSWTCPGETVWGHLWAQSGPFSHLDCIAEVWNPQMCQASVP